MGMKDIHEGETCIIMGNGPSLNDVPKEFLDSYITLGSNKIFRLPYRPDYYVIADKTALESCLPVIKNGWRPKKQMFLRAEACVEGNYPIYPVVVSGAFSVDIDNCVMMGGTATYVLFQIASYLGFKKIYLVGVDHYYPKSMTGETGVFTAEGDDPDHFVCEGGQPYHTPGETCVRPQDTTIVYGWAKKIFDELGIKVINLTEGSKLDIFEKGNLKSVQTQHDTQR